MIEQVCIKLAVHIVLLAEHTEIHEEHGYTATDYDRLIPNAFAIVAAAALAPPGRPTGRTTAEIGERLIVRGGLIVGRHRAVVSTRALPGFLGLLVSR